MPKSRLVMLLICCGLLSYSASAQRYLNHSFSEIQIDSQVVYGRNANVLPTFAMQEAEPQLLRADIYAPKNDTETARPVMIIVPAGNFLPHPENGSIARGNRKDSADVYLAKQLAQLGYVSIIPDLRVGWNPLAVDLADRQTTALQAMMRQAQDIRTLIRFLKKSVAEQANPYQIKADKIGVWGNDSGFYPTQLAAYLADYQEFLQHPVFYTQDENGTPIPMWDETIHGDIFGTNFGIDPLNGDTLSYPNHTAYTDEIQLVVQLGRAALDTSFISAGEAPIISFKATAGGFSPWFHTLIPPLPPIPVLFNEDGVGHIHTRVQSIGLNEDLQVLDFTDPVTQQRNAQALAFPDLFPQDFPELFALSHGFGLPWMFWEDDNQNNNEGLGLSPNDHLLAKSILDSMITFVAPRACLALELDCDLTAFITSTEEASPAPEVSIKVYPNPASNEITVADLSGAWIEEVYLYQMNGQLIKSYRDLSAGQIKISIENVAKGGYILKIRGRNGVTLKRVLVH